MSAIGYIYTAAVCIAAASLCLLAAMRVYDEVRFRKGEKYVQQVGNVVLMPEKIQVEKKSAPIPNRPANTATKRAKNWIDARTGGKGEGSL